MCSSFEKPCLLHQFLCSCDFFLGGGGEEGVKAAVNKILLFIMVKKSCYRQLQMIMAAIWQFTSCHSVIDVFQILFTW